MREIRSLSFLLVLMFLGTNASALESASVADPEVRLDLEYPLAIMPVLSQGSSKLCSAYTAAQLADVYRLTHSNVRPDHLTSPVKVALDAAYDEWESGLKKEEDPSGKAWQMIDKLREKGSCNQLMIKGSYKDQDLGGFLNGLKLCRMQMEAVVDSGWTPQKAKNILMTLKSCQNYVDVNSEVRPSLLRTYLAFTAKNHILAYKAFFDQQCFGHTIPVTLPSVTVVHKNGFYPKGDLIQRITPFVSHILQTKHEPVGIDYCHTVLTTEKYRGIWAPGKLADDCELHASIVVGQRVRPEGAVERKEFLIRDSWGTNCSLYSRHKECRGGQIWVPTEELEANVTHAYAL